MRSLQDWDWQAGKSQEGWPAILHENLRLFLATWRDLHGPDGSLPKKRDLDPVNIKPLLPGLVIFEVLPQPDGAYRYRYRLLGSDHDRANKRPLTGLFLDEVHTEQEVEIVTQVYRRIIETREPHYWTRANALPNRDVTRYQRVLAPFAGADDTVAFLIGAWVWESL